MKRAGAASIIAALGALLAAVLLAAGCSHGKKSPAQASTPEAAVKAFLNWRIDSRLTGAPSSQELAAMAPYISDELQGLLAAARVEYDGGGPGEQRRRLLGESDLFSSMFEGPTSFALGKTQSQGAEHVIPVRFMSARHLPAINWVDHVYVVREHDHYVVADIEYANHWSLGTKATLREALKRATPKREG